MGLDDETSSNHRSIRFRCSAFLPRKWRKGLKAASLMKRELSADYADFFGGHGAIEDLPSSLFFGVRVA